MDRKKLENYDLKQIMQLFYKRKWLILICIASFLVPALVYNFKSVPVYRADTSIIYDKHKGAAVIIDQFHLATAQNVIINQIEQIQSRSMVEEVVQNLPADVLATFPLPRRLPPGFDKHEFWVNQIQERITASAVPNSDIIQIEVEAYSPEAAKTVANTIIKAVQQRSLAIEKQETSNVREIIAEQLITFKVQLDEAEMALKQYKERNKVTNINKEAEEVLQRITEAENLYNQTQANLDAARERLSFVQSKLEQERQDLVPAITKITSHSIHKQKEQLVELEVQLTTLRLQGYDADHPKFKKLKSEIAQTKESLKQESLKITAGENIVDPISQIQKFMEETISLEIEIETYQAQERTLKGVISLYEQELNKLPDKELKLAQLMRDKEVNEKIYTMLLEKREEAKIAEAERVGNIRIIDTAKTPKNPIKPRKTINLIIGFLLGVVMGIGLTFLLELINTKVETVEDVERHAGLIVAGTIPKIRNNLLVGSRKNSFHNGTDEVTEFDSRLITAHNPGSIYSEAFRTLTVNIQFATRNHNSSKILLVTSASPGDGKSFVAANLAISTARMGFRTLLIDSDLRKPIIHELFQLNLEPGLVNILSSEQVRRIAENSNAILVDNSGEEHTRLKSSGHSQRKNKKQPNPLSNQSLQETLEASIKTTDIPNLDILTSGMIPPSPSEHLASKSMKNILHELTRHYDAILIDSPPFNLVTDAQILSLVADGLLLVVKSGSSTLDDIREFLRFIQKSPDKQINIVLNHVDAGNRTSKFRRYYSNNNGQKG